MKAWLAVTALIVMALYGAGLVFYGVALAPLGWLGAGIVQVAYWISGDQALDKNGNNMASATGPGNQVSVRTFEPPHTGTNYLLREFAHVVGRKHAAKLRIISLILMIGTPVLILSTNANIILILIAVLAHIAGLFVSRWLFFAQAEHVAAYIMARDKVWKLNSIISDDYPPKPVIFLGTQDLEFRKNIFYFCGFEAFEA